MRVGDFDNDGLPDLAVALADRVILFHNLGGGKFEDVTAKVGIRQLNKPAGLTFVDFDHDGDLDLFVTGAATADGKSGPNVMWRNNGNSTFTEWTGPTGLAGSGSTTQPILSDINNDRAVDFVVTGRGTAGGRADDLSEPARGCVQGDASVRRCEPPGDARGCGIRFRQRRMDGCSSDARGCAGVDAVAECGGEEIRASAATVASRCDECVWRDAD